MTTTARMLWTGLLVIMALPLLLWLWGFSVDDAWIVTRVVENGRKSGEFSFNLGAARTDALTPLGFAELLSAVCRLVGTADAFLAARVLGAGCLVISLAAAAWTALAPGADPLGGLPLFGRLLAWLATAAVSPSLAAWAGAGLETPVVACLCTLGCAVWERAALAGRGAGGRAAGALLLGAATAWRPELLGFSLACAFQLERSAPSGPTPAARFGLRALGLLAVLALPSLVALGLRLAWFGAPLPLSLSAKEPDLASGLRYAVGSLLLCGPLWLLWPLLLGASEGARRWLPAFAAHALCVALAGGDWMPLYRLWVPVLPWLIAVGVRELRPSRVAFASLFAAACTSTLLLFAYGSATRQVIPRRERMVAELRATLGGARAVAAVDIGWVGRATSAEVIDLAGVTDPRVAALPGGHTSKRIHPGFFSARSVDTWLIRAADRSYVPAAPLSSIRCVYAVDQGLVRRAENLGFRAVSTLVLPGTGEQYVVARHESVLR